MVNKITTVLEPFLSRPHDKIHLAELSRLLKVPHPTLRLWLNKLEKDGVLRTEKIGRMMFYSLNHGYMSLPHYLVIAEKQKLIRKCDAQPVLANLVETLTKELDGPLLIFGSVVDSFKGANDIDVLLIGTAKPEILRKISRYFNKEVHLIDVKLLDETELAFKSEVTKKHLLVSDSELFIKWFLCPN